MTQSFEKILHMLKEREKKDLKSRETKKLIREINQETDGVETQAIDFCTGLLCSNREEPDHDTLESSL